jgi:hypothetical protein
MSPGTSDFSSWKEQTPFLACSCPGEDLEAWSLSAQLDGERFKQGWTPSTTTSPSPELDQPGGAEPPQSQTSNVGQGVRRSNIEKAADSRKSCLPWMVPCWCQSFPRGAKEFGSGVFGFNPAILWV